MRSNNVIAQKAQRKKLYLTLCFLLLLALLLYTCHALRSSAHAEPLPVHSSARETRCPPVTSPCIMTTDVSTRMGNKILNYWFLISLAKIHNCTAYLAPKMAEQLLPHFNLSAPILTPEVYFATQWTFVDILDAGTKCRAEFRGDNIFLIGFWSKHCRRYLPFLEDVRAQLTLKPEVVARAQQKLRNISRIKNYKTFVSVHARRGDYVSLNYKNRVLSTDSKFYSSAMDHFRSKYGQVAFVVVSDDMEWCRENIVSNNGDVFYEGSDVAIDDFALMANCNHSVIGFSTFAYFAAILSAGDVIYFTNNSHPENAFNQWLNIDEIALDHWTPIAADLSRLPTYAPPVEKMYALAHNYYLEWFKYAFELYSILVVVFSPLFYLPDYFSLV